MLLHFSLNKTPIIPCIDIVLRDMARARDQEHQLPRVKQRRGKLFYRVAA